MLSSKKKKCRYCGLLFQPDPRNRRKQQYCSKPKCRKASKAASQKKWCKKNPDYFRSRENVERVRRWRQSHPGYSRRTKSLAGDISVPPLQDHLTGKNKQIQGLKELLPASALQDLLTSQPAVFIGLIALFTGSKLQDEIAAGLLKVVNLGQDILNSYNLDQGERHDAKKTHLSGKSPPGTGTVQLDRSPPGA